MNAQEYAEYETNVADFLKDFDGEPSTGYWAEERECDCPPDDTCECENEPFFSWSQCPCCRSTLGGDRMDMIGWLAGARAAGFDDEHKWSGAICCDCEYYFAYGRLDDMTMLDIEGSVA